MRTLDRYIVRTFAWNAILFFLVLMSLRIVFDLFVKIDEFVTIKDLTTLEKLQQMASYYGYQSTVYLTELGGIMIVASAAFTLARMNHTNELTAMLASGVSLRRVVLPIVLCAVALDLVVIYDQEYIIPSVGDKLVLDPDDVPGRQEFEVRLMTDGNGTVWYSTKFRPAVGEMEMPVAMLRDKQMALVAVLSGPSARPATVDGEDGWMFSGNNPSTIQRAGEGNRWLFTPDTSAIWTYASPQGLLKTLEGPTTRMGRPASDVERVSSATGFSARDPSFGMEIRYKKFTADPPDGDKPRGGNMEKPRFTFYADDGQLLGTILADSARWVQGRQDIGYWQLQGGKLFYPNDMQAQAMALRQSSRWLDYMATSELEKLIQLKRVPDRNAAMLAKHTRFTDPVNNIVMLLIGLPFILSRERNIKASAAMCLGMVAFYYVFIYACRYMNMDPMLAAWLPILIFGPISADRLYSVKT